jgi:hypothetical protein
MIQIQGFDGQNLEKKIQLKNYIKKNNCNLRYLSLGLDKDVPSYRRSLQLSKEHIQHFKI